MDKNEIVRKYKRLKMLCLLIPVISAVILLLLGCSVSDIDLVFCLVLWWFGLPIYCLLDSILVSHFGKKWGMTEKEIKEFISKQEEEEAFWRKEQVERRKEQEAFWRKEQEEQEKQEALRRKKREILGWNPVKYTFPFIREICKLNKGAKEAQKAILSDFLSKKEIEIIFDDFRKLGSLEDAILCWRERSLPERLSFMRFLFKLAILQDGIHNDEWNMLMNLICQLRFSNYYREDFRYRYFSLRTEFYDYERKSSTSTEDNSASTNNSSSSLKPYFTVLGLEETASDEEIKRAYHKLALQHHPDMQKNADRIKECEAMMAKINEAYEKLRG